MAENKEIKNNGNEKESKKREKWKNIYSINLNKIGII